MYIDENVHVYGPDIHEFSWLHNYTSGIGTLLQSHLFCSETSTFSAAIAND